MEEIKKWVKKLFCKHDYRIRVTYGLGVNMMSNKLVATAVDGAEINCICIKCGKVIASATMTTNGKLIS